MGNATASRRRVHRRCLKKSISLPAWRRTPSTYLLCRCEPRELGWRRSADHHPRRGILQGQQRAGAHARIVCGRYSQTRAAARAPGIRGSSNVPRRDAQDDRREAASPGTGSSSSEPASPGRCRPSSECARWPHSFTQPQPACTCPAEVIASSTAAFARSRAQLARSNAVRTRYKARAEPCRDCLLLTRQCHLPLGLPCQRMDRMSSEAYCSRSGTRSGSLAWHQWQRRTTCDVARHHRSALPAARPGRQGMSLN